MARVEVAGDESPAVGSSSTRGDADEKVDPARRGSPLGSLRARREAIQAELYIDIKVPRWEDHGGPAIYVRCKAMSPAFMQASIDKRKKPKGGHRDEDWVVLANADVLVHSCLGVFAIDDDVTPAQAEREQLLSLREGDPHGEWTKFDPDLAAALGLEMENPSAVRVARALFFTDGDLTTSMAKLGTFSGFTNPAADEDF